MSLVLAKTLTLVWHPRATRWQRSVAQHVLQTGSISHSTLLEILPLRQQILLVVHS